MALDSNNSIIGVFNVSAITQAIFKSIYLGYNASFDYAGKVVDSETIEPVAI